MKISFHGADQGVTGSCHLIECAGKRILIDCGLYQGGRELVEENAEPFGFEPESIDYLLLTHAHLDHCGRIPLLVKRGFKGEVITTAATVELARLVMLDSAGLQEEEARYEQRKANRRSGSHKTNKHSTNDIEPLYTTIDALNSLDYFGRKANYDQSMKLAEGIRATFIDAGHILGSASIFLELQEGEKKHRILFSGDLGYSDRAILRNPAAPPEVDTVVMETTYGDRLHKQLKPSIEELYSIINETIGRGGNVIIPTFALERAQEILYYLREGVNNKDLKHYINVYLDSPMAISATQIFERHPECYNQETLQAASNGNDPFDLPGLRFTRETAESIAISQLDGGAVIMAGSGMCTGGRVRHHLKHNLWGRKNSIIFVGFAARGTLARKIVDGAERVRIFSEDIQVNASIHTIGGFSAHADQAELLAWHSQTGKPATTFLVHGEEDSMNAFEKKLKGNHVVIPSLGEEYEL
ncbi:Metallo-beta-lactamase family protein, RNA-specific [hydrothermal vent metagenome]|uniref:Metallo-beta-lactamase family protein, RNA-specific n=1 Tax=hydrothermal vent metagenome TaxID=652676 RepID=A0A3B0XKL6_9ZZZZ